MDSVDGKIIFYGLKIDELSDADLIAIWNDKRAAQNITLNIEFLKLAKLQNEDILFYTGYLCGVCVCQFILSVTNYSVWKFRFITIMLGSAKSNGKAIWFEESIVSYEILFSELIVKLRKSFKYDFLILRDFSEKDLTILSFNKLNGFVNFHSYTNSYLITNAETSFNQYLDSLTSKKRYYLKSILKQRNKNEFQVEITDVTCELIDEVYPLYLQTNRKAIENKSMPVNSSFFYQLVESHLGSKVIIVRKQSQAIGFGLMLYNGNSLKCQFTGFDYVYATRYSLWYQIMIESIKYALNSGYININLGSTALSMKKKFAGQYEKSYLSVQYRNQFWTVIMKPLIERMLKSKFKPETVSED